MTRNGLIGLFTAVFCIMMFVTIRASLERGVFDNAALMGDVWFQATLADAYLGFITFYVWVAWREQSTARRVVWFVLIMTLGNLAMSVYVLILLLKLPPDSDLRAVLDTRS